MATPTQLMGQIGPILQLVYGDGTNNYSLDISSRAFLERGSHMWPVTFGASANQINRLWHDRRTLSSTSENLDLAGGVTDVLGNTVTFDAVKLLYISADASNADDLVIGAAASNAWATLFNAAGTMTIPAGGQALIIVPGTGWTVTAGTGDILKVNHASGVGKYNIIVGGHYTAP